jgi:hypothetical protein
MTDSTAERLLVCGWDDALPPLLRALRRDAALEVCAVGDQRAGQLVRARQATAAPCYQHVREMLRAVPAAAVLVAAPGAVPVAAQHAATRGQDLLLLGPAMDGAALVAAASAAALHGVRCLVLRPGLRGAGLAQLQRLSTDVSRETSTGATHDEAWRPRLLAIELRAPAPAAALLRDAVAAAASLLPLEPHETVGSFAGASLAAATTLAVQLRYRDGRLATLTARTGPELRTRVTLEAEAGSAELRSLGAESDLELAPVAGTVRHALLRDRDLLALEAKRVAAERARPAASTTPLLAEAATLRAVEAALESGLVQAVREFAPRPALRLLSGGARAATPPRGPLQLVPS